MWENSANVPWWLRQKQKQPLLCPPATHPFKLPHQNLNLVGDLQQAGLTKCRILRKTAHEPHGFFFAVDCLPEVGFDAGQLLAGEHDRVVLPQLWDIKQTCTSPFPQLPSAGGWLLRMMRGVQGNLAFCQGDAHAGASGLALECLSIGHVQVPLLVA